MIGLIKMFGDRGRIRKVAIVENGAAMLPKALVEMALGLPNVLFASFLHSKSKVCVANRNLGQI